MHGSRPATRCARKGAITGNQREYLYRLLGACAADGAGVESIVTEDATDLLATKLRTPFQIQLHLTLAFEVGYRTGEKPVSAALGRIGPAPPA